MNRRHTLGFKYTDLRMIGIGAFGKVYSAVNSLNNETVVIKKIPKDTDMKYITNEIKSGIVLQGVPNIIQYIECFESDNNFWLVLELVEGENLFQYMSRRESKPLDESEVKNIFKQIYKALVAAHERGIVHMDIKLENIMYDEKTGKITLIDFGLSSHYDNGTKVKTYCGTKEYCAPEVKNNIPFIPEKADIWSLGVALFALLRGIFPFSSKGLEDFTMTGIHPSMHISWRDTSKDAQKLLSMMLQTDASKRASLRELGTHPWLKKRNWFSKTFKSN